MDYVTQYFTWQNIKIAVRFHPNRFPVSNQENADAMAHLEIKSMEPLNAPIPISETGYKSHFVPKDAILAYGTPLEFVKEWLNVQSQTKLWKAHLERSRQGVLF